MLRMLLKQFEGCIAQVNQARPAHVRHQRHHEIVYLAALDPHGCPPGTNAISYAIEMYVHVLHACDLVVSEAQDSRLYDRTLRPHSVYVNFLGHHPVLPPTAQACTTVCTTWREPDPV